LNPYITLQGSKLAGKSVQRAGLRGIPGLFLVCVDQADGTQLHAVAPEYVLKVLAIPTALACTLTTAKAMHTAQPRLVH